MRLFLLQGSPQPVIDVFDALKLGPQALLEAKNPYNYQYSKVYSEQLAYTFYPYPPGSLIFLTPIVAMFKDPRLLFILSEFFAAVLLYKIAKKNTQNQKIMELIPITYLFFPQSFFILEQSWLDPLLILLVSLLAYLLIYTSQKSYLLKGIVLGITMGIKSYAVIFPIFFLGDIKKHKKMIITAVIVLLAIIAPFFLHDPNSFNPYRLNYEYRLDALTINSFLFHNFKVFLPRWAIYLSWLLLTFIVITKQSKEYAQTYLSMAYWFTGLFFFSFIAFINEYYLPYALLIIAYTLSLKSSSVRYRAISTT